jgi:DNA-directed RNA polymerase specialized sigma24 family protein
VPHEVRNYNGPADLLGSSASHPPAAKQPRPAAEHEMISAERGEQTSPARTGRCAMGESGESAPQAVSASDAELINAVASGDAAAYAKLRERHLAAARSLAGALVADPAAAEVLLSETFAQVHGVLRRGEGPAEALRPFLLTALRRVAHDRQEGGRAGAAGSQETIRNLGEPLFTDPAAAELENDPMARAFRSLPERQQAVLWHAEIERGDPAETTAMLGLAGEGLAQAAAQARAAIGRGYLDLHASARAGQECEEAAAKLDPHLAGAVRGADEAMVQRHLRSCRDCRAAAVELTGLSRSLRRTVAPIFLGPAAGAYLAAAAAKPAGTAAPGPAAVAAAWLSRARWRIGQVPRRVGQVPRWVREAPRQHRALAGGVVLLAAAAAAGLTLTLAANGSPQHAGQQPVAAVIAPQTPPAASPPASPPRSVTHPRSGSATRRSPASAKSPSPAPSTPIASASPPPVPSHTPSPGPLPAPPPRHRHRHPFSTA